MNVWYKPRLQSVDNIIKTQVLGGEVSPKQIVMPSKKRRWMSSSRR